MGSPAGVFEYADAETAKEVIRVLHNLTFGNPGTTLEALPSHSGIKRGGATEAFPARFDNQLGNKPKIARFSWSEWVDSGRQYRADNYEVTDTRAANVAR